jgi:translation initiation factor 1
MGVKKMSQSNKGRVVFSTADGDQRKQRHQVPRPAQSLPPAQHNLKIMRDKKGRRGKVVTVVSGFRLSEADLKELAKTLKNYCGAGGTAKNEPDGQVIEIQGDHRDKVAEKLSALGYKAKFAGG